MKIGKKKAKEKTQKEKQPKLAKAKKTKEPPRPEYTDSGGLDYDVYYMKKSEYLLTVLAAAVVLAALGFVFYQSPLVSALVALLAFKYPAMRTKSIIAKRRQKLMLQFKDMLYSLSSAIGAGNSIESAMRVVLDDMEHQYVSNDTYIIKELELIISKLEMNQNIEDLFKDLAERSGLEDILVFSNIFGIAKRTGGNMIQIIRQTSDIITQKIETKMEIETVLAEKKMEQKIMAAMPIVLTVMLSYTAKDYMAPLFATLGGRVVSTIAVVLIAVGFLWGRKLTDIII